MTMSIVALDCETGGIDPNDGVPGQRLLAS